VHKETNTPVEVQTVSVASTSGRAFTFGMDNAPGRRHASSSVVAIRPDGKMIFFLTVHAPRDFFDSYLTEFQLS